MLQIGPFSINFEPLLQAANVSPIYGAWYAFVHGGWVFLLLVILTGFKWIWMRSIQLKVARKWKWILLSIDVPRENIQTPKAVENIMAHLAGAHGGATALEKYITGHAQTYFSLELASINGFIRFFVYTVDKNRDLVESAVYAQYPTAEITEAEDYTHAVPDHFPDPDYDMWGAEFILAKNQAYPIRTWEEFHDTTSEEAGYKDPMAAMLETMSSLREGEQLWFQVIIVPIKSGSWQEKSDLIVAKLAGIKSEHKDTLLEKIIRIPSQFIIGLIDFVMVGTPAADHQAKQELPSKMLYLTPGDREVIEKIENKSAKLGFKTKIRAVYIAKKEVFHKPRAVYGIIGAIKQFNTEDLNSLKPELHKVGTHTKYLWKETRKNWRKTKVTRAYKGRSDSRGMKGFVMNVEELATIWHFPVAESVKAPLVKKSESKRGAPPYEIPTQGSPRHQGMSVPQPPVQTPPRNLPIG